MTFAKIPGNDPVQATTAGAMEGAAEAALEKAVGNEVKKVTGTIDKVADGMKAAQAIAGGEGLGKQITSLTGAQAAASMGGSIPGFAGGSVPLKGEAVEQELPFFEEKAITSLSGSAAGAAVNSLAGSVGGMLGGLAGAIAGRLHGKNLEIHVASGDALDVRNFSVQERLSSLFQVNLVAVSDNHGIDFDAVVGQPARFELHGGRHDRAWSGLCSHFEQVRVEPSGLSTYQLTLVPKLWLLTQRKNYRIFQQISEPDIVLKLLDEWDIKPVLRIDRAAYKKRKYRVQYAETDFAFLSRMLEDAGISFYFESNGETKVVLSDAPQTNPKRLPPLSFTDDTSSANRSDSDHATSVRMGQRVRPGKVTMRDHDYRRPPSYKLLSSATGGQGIESKLEQYHYSPGAFLFGVEHGDATPSADDKGKTRTDEKEAAILAQKRLDAKRGSARVCTFETNAHDLAPGMVLSMAGHPHGGLGDSKKLLVVESSLSGTERGEWSHHCEARGTEVPFRPEVVTPRPLVNGVESATVVGPKGEEIHTDEFGRVRVHFHWDRESQMDDNSSCWVHVSQPWGGSGYGGVNLPRVGQEVLVDFLGGDPDRPVIVGRMYTNLQKVPYKLPANKTQSGWRSNSTGGGGGYNEIMFEDAQGREVVNIQAEKNLTELVKNDASHTVKHDRTTTVWNDDSALVGAHYSVTMGTGGKSPPSAGNTCLKMEDHRIEFTTGEASIVLDGANIRISANKNIILAAIENIGIGATKQIGVSGDEGVGILSPAQISIEGKSGVFINCSEGYTPPSEVEPSMLDKAMAGLLGVGAALLVISQPVLAGAVVGALVASSMLGKGSKGAPAGQSGFGEAGFSGGGFGGGGASGSW